MREQMSERTEAACEICRLLNINFDNKKLELKIKAAGADGITPSPVGCAPNKLLSKPRALDLLSD